MRRIVFLEGLPGVGKTTIINKITELKLDNVFTVNEIVKEDIINNISNDEKDYIINDEMKIDMTKKDGIIIMDRGPISTLAYNQTKNIINKKFDKRMVEDWFDDIKNIYLENHKIFFLTNKSKKFTLTSSSDLDPYGTIENQKLLETITLYDCYKYSKNVVIREYHKHDIMEVINEIIS